MDPVTPLVLLLKGLLHGIVTKIPDLATDRIRDTSVRRELERLRTDVHYFLDVVDRMNDRREIGVSQSLQAQQQIIERQMEIIQTLIGMFRPISQQVDSFVSSRQLLSSSVAVDAVSDERLARFVVDARSQVRSDFAQASKLASPDEALDVIARMVRLQFTAPVSAGPSHEPALRRVAHSCVSLFAVHLLCRRQRNGSASARVRYRQLIPSLIPDTESEWQDALATGAEQFGTFVRCPAMAYLCHPSGGHGVHADGCP